MERCKKAYRNFMGRFMNRVKEVTKDNISTIEESECALMYMVVDIATYTPLILGWGNRDFDEFAINHKFPTHPLSRLFSYTYYKTFHNNIHHIERTMITSITNDDENKRKKEDEDADAAEDKYLTDEQCIAKYLDNFNDDMRNLSKVLVFSMKQMWKYH